MGCCITSSEASGPSNINRRIVEDNL